MTGLEVLFTFYMFVNLMNLDTIVDTQNERIEQLERDLSEYNRIEVLAPSK